jgi:ADP-heptose:LPS heptosyltransferase
MNFQKQIQRILFIELLGGIGDVVIALPAIQALGRSHPAATVTVLTFAPGSELLHHHPLIQQVVEAQRGAARQAVEALLAAESFDLIVSDTTYDGIAELIQATQAECVVPNLWRSPPADQRVGDRFLKLLLTDRIITPAAAAQELPELHLLPSEHRWARQQFGAAYRPLVFLCPDAGMAIKRWPVKHWIALGQAWQPQGGTIVVPVGADRAQAEEIAGAIRNSRLWPPGPLRQLAAGLAAADLVIAADTGIARIAAALNVPTITLFGPSWHQRYGQPAPHINLQADPECPERQIHNFTAQVCWYSGDCPLPAWQHTCLEEIAPETVLAAATSLLTAEKLSEKSNANSSRTPSTLPTPNWQTVRNLLVMRLDNIGDVIMTSPALRSLRSHLPQAKITLLASPGGAFVAPLLPWVDDVLPWRVLWQDLGRLDFDPTREWELIATLRDRQFDAAVIFTSFSQSPHPAGLICTLAGIPIRIGESKEQDFGTLTHAVPPAADELHQVDRNLRLLEFTGIAVSDRSLWLQLPDAYKLLIPSQPYILLNPWTSCQSRNYPTDRLAMAAQQLSDLTSWAIVVTGVAKDRDRARPLLEALGQRAIDVIGQTDLTELVALVANAKLVITNNTSTMHIADAMRTPMVVLFAGTELECQWQPRSSPTRLLRQPTVCNPCYAFTCPYELQCLEIPPESIVSAALNLLNF